MSARSPLLARLLLRWFLPLRDREFILGDLDEEFAGIRAPRDGVRRARRWYWRQAFASLVSEARYEIGDAPTVVPGESRGGAFFDPLWQDIRYALRSLNRRPVFTTVAIVTLALGIGANTGIFSIANWLLLRPVAGVAQPNELAMVEFAEAPGQNVSISWLNLTDLLQAQRSFSGLAGFGRVTLQVRAGDAHPESIAGEVVGGDYFGVLGIRLQLGRPIQAEETASGRPAHVVVISDDLWSRLYQRDPDVVGTTLRANHIALTVIGVAPPDFQGVERQGGVEAWLPQSIYHELRHADADFAQRLQGRRGGGMRELVGRLRPGVTAEAARYDLQRLMDALIAQYPEDNRLYTERPVIVHAGIGVPVLMRERTATTVRLMLIVVGMLLVISSANVGNMLLVRGLQARPDAAVRRAVGASAGRLASQQITECVLLALAGGLAGLLSTALFLRFVEGGSVLGMPAFADIPMDSRVLAFTAAVSVGTGLLFAVAPLRVLQRTNPLLDLQSAGSRHTLRKHWLRDGIATAQIALSLTLLVGALLLTRTIINLQRIDLGFDPERIAGFYTDAEPQGYSYEFMPAFRRKLLDVLRAQPEVERAALARSVPFGCCGFGSRVQDPLGRSDELIEIDVQFASDGYFETLGIPIVRGRGIEPRDWHDGPGPVPTVLSETAARKLFGDRDPIGKSLTTPSDELLVIGIARDSRISGLHEPPSVLVYMPFHQFPTTQLSVVMRGRASAVGLEQVARRALATVDPGLPLRFRIISESVRNSISEQRLFARILSLFAGLALLLSGIGLYGILAFITGERTREFGIRMALGARARRVGVLVMRQAARLVIPGLLLGVMGARWLGRIIESTLYGVSQLEVSVLIAALALMTVVATIATLIPSRAATRVEPVTALRNE